jgi:hypothetical protein
VPLAQSLSTRVLSRLISAEAQEPDPWLRDDLKIARLTVVHAARGDAVECSADVLASYEVLGLHPEKVWPAIQRRRKALLGPLCENVSATPPKKPAQSVKLWSEKTAGARAANSRAGGTILVESATSVPMAAPSIAALYPNPDAPASAKTREYPLGEIQQIVAHSGAPPTVVAVTLAALSARGEWPYQDGPATTILSVSLLGIMYDSTPSCCRRTAQRRIKRALKDEYWRRARGAHSWTDCPKCGAKRKSGACDAPGCDYVGRSKDAKGNWTGEFMRVPTYEFDIEKFRHAPRCKELRPFDPLARTYAEHKEAAKRGHHSKVADISARKPAAPAAPVRQAAAEHTHRNPVRSASSSARKLTSREGPKLFNQMRHLMRGYKGSQNGSEGTVWIGPEDPRYREPMSQEKALSEACRILGIPLESAEQHLKLCGWKLGESP